MQQHKYFHYRFRERLEMLMWDNYGTDRRESFERRLEPNELAYELQRYQKTFGKDFKLQDLLQIEEIRSQALVAEAINDVPEFLLDQIGKMRNCYDVPTIVRAMDNIADAVNRIADE